MSRVLPHGVQTKKVKSLPDDLKSIAEELIADKFGIVEEVVPEVDDFFHDPRFRQEFPTGPDEVFFGPRMDDRRDRRGDVGFLQVRQEPWSRLRVAEIEITYPSYENLVRAMRELDINNIRDREKREFVFHPEFYHFLMRDMQIARYMRHTERGTWREGEKQVVGELMGCNVIVTHKVRHALLIARF